MGTAVSDTTMGRGRLRDVAGFPMGIVGLLHARAERLRLAVLHYA